MCAQLRWLATLILLAACGTNAEGINVGSKDAGARVQPVGPPHEAAAPTAVASVASPVPAPSVSALDSAHPERQTKVWIIAEDVRLSETQARPHGPPPAKGACFDISKAKPRIAPAWQIDRCSTVRGYWGIGAVLVPETQAGVAGYRVLRPFRFVRERNPSLGWPSWYALDAIIVDNGWIEAKSLDSLSLPTERKDPLFEDPVTIKGTLRKPPSNISRLWEHFDNVRDVLDLAPYGQNSLPILIEVNGP
jgi:hypothetical protein